MLLSGSKERNHAQRPIKRTRRSNLRGFQDWGTQIPNPVVVEVDQATPSSLLSTLPSSKLSLLPPNRNKASAPPPRPFRLVGLIQVF